MRVLRCTECCSEIFDKKKLGCLHDFGVTFKILPAKLFKFFLICFSSQPDEAAGSDRRPTAAQPSKRSFGGAPPPPPPHPRPGPRLSRQPLGRPRLPAHGQRVRPLVEPFDGAAGTLGQKSRLGTGRRRGRRREQRERALPAAELSTSHLYSRQSPQHQQHYQ